MVAHNFVANPDATAAKNAAVMVDNQEVIQGVSSQGREGIRITRVVHLIPVSQALQLTVPAGGAKEAKMVALCEYQFQDLLSVLL
jgi:hypothetical protein